MEILKFLDWGIAAIFAIAMFLIYRHSVNQMRDDRKFMEDRLTGIIIGYNEMATNRTKVMMDMTQVLTELITWLKAKNGH